MQASCIGCLCNNFRMMQEFEMLLCMIVEITLKISRFYYINFILVSFVMMLISLDTDLNLIALNTF
jgi:hypothetical protein